MDFGSALEQCLMRKMDLIAFDSESDMKNSTIGRK